MIKVAAKSCLLVLGGFVTANIISVVILSSSWLTTAFGINKIGPEVYEVLRKSKTNFESETIILGDSVARQLFLPVNDVDAGINNLTSNQAISLAGQYIIAHNALKNGPNVKKILLMYHPSTFSNNLNQPFTFNYFVRPFFTDEYRGLFTPLVYKKLRESSYSFFFNFSLSKTIPAFSTIDYSAPKKVTTPVADNRQDKAKKLKLSFSEISIEYLDKLYTLCRENGISLKVIPPPISRRCNDDYDYGIMKSQIRNNRLEGIFDEYFERLSIIDNSYFLPDNLHFKTEYINVVSNESLKNLLLK